MRAAECLLALGRVAARGPEGPGEELEALTGALVLLDALRGARRGGG